MLTALIMSLALAAQAPAAPTPASPPPPPPDASDPCAQPANCRMVDAINLSLPDGKTASMKIGHQIPFLIHGEDGKVHLGLTPGDRVVIRLGRPGEAAMVLVTTGHDSDVKAGVEPPPADKDTIRLTFKQTGGAPGMMLVVENGYRRALRYRANLITFQDSKPTDVCVVKASFASYESWPDIFPLIDLSAFELVDGDADPGKLVCQ